MSRKINKLLLLALPLALAACGGGGGDNPAADNNKPQNQNNNSAQPDDGVTYTGVMFNAKGERAPTTGRSKFVLNDGKVQYQLPRSSQGATQQGNLLIYGSATGKGGHYTAPDGKSYESFQLSNNLYYYSQFGVAKPVDGEIGGFYRGVAVSNMPTSGSATYKGDAIVGLWSGDNFNRTEAGTVQANADFAGKKLAISLASPSYKGNINANIEGSNFSGKDGSKSTIGSFYGPNAEELGGTYDDNNTTAVFGARR